MSIATVSFAKKEDALYAYLEGEIDHDSAQFLRKAIDEQIVSNDTQKLVLDFGQVGFMDSSGLGLILGRKKRIEFQGGVLSVQHPPEQIEKILKLVAVECAEV